VTSVAQVDALAARLQGRAIDVLVNNAGIIGDRTTQALGRFDYEDARKVFETNTLAPMKITEALLPNLLAGQQKKLITLSQRGLDHLSTRHEHTSHRASNCGQHGDANLAFAVKKDGIRLPHQPGPGRHR
jgi:NAD(P)-dependent dehydrogenase (short-subunit alcohol dehydrogenase family)